MAKARHSTGLREERSTCRVRSSRRDPKICEILYFFTPFSQNLTFLLKNLSKTSLFSPLFDPKISTFRPQNLNFSTPDSENRTPESSLFWPPESEKSSLFGVTFHYFWHFFKFFDTFLSFLTLFSVFWHFWQFFQFFVTFDSFFSFWSLFHFLSVLTLFSLFGVTFSLFGGVEIGVKNGPKKRSEMPISETHIS